MNSILSRTMTSEGESAHEFGALNTLLLVVILGLCIISSYLIKQNSFYYLPESGAAIIVGLVVGGLTRLVYPSKEEMNFLSFDPQLFFFLLLPPIIFEAGYSLKKKDFFANFWSISLFAVGGTIVSTFVTGFLVYLVSLTGIIRMADPLEGLLFGALISSVDPVATLSIMGNPELNCDPLLYSLVFGESVLNDAVAIVLFNTFRKFYDLGKVFTVGTLVPVMISFSFISLGSLCVGVVTSLVCCYLCKQTKMKLYPEYEISMLFLFAYGSYSLAEALELSGIMSLFSSSIILSYYNGSNLSQTSQVTAHCIFKSLAVLCEFFMFLYMGMGFFTGKFKDWNFFFIFLTIIFCFISRAFNIYPFSALANTFRSKPIPHKMQNVMWFSGLRGAMSFALSMNLSNENRDLYVSTTLCVVIFTTIICGGLTEPLLDKMGMKRDATDSDDDNRTDTIEYMAVPQSTASSQESGLADLPMDSSSSPALGTSTAPPSTRSGRLATSLAANTSSFWQRFDNNVMKPTFGGVPADPESVHECNLLLASRDHESSASAEPTRLDFERADISKRRNGVSKDIH